MNNLSQECMELVKNECHEGYGDTFHYEAAVEAMEEALTNPAIFQSAGLMSVDEGLEIIKWMCVESRDTKLPPIKLLTIFRNQNK